MPKPKSIIAKNRNAAFKRQKGRCYYCGFPMWSKSLTLVANHFRPARKQPTRLECTAEHLVAKQDGGGNTRVNVVAACRFCNNTRHKYSSPPDPEAYRQHVTRRLHAGKWHPKELFRLVSASM